MKREIIMVAMTIIITFFIFLDLSFAGSLNPPPLFKGGQGGVSSGEKSRYIVIYGLVENFIWQERFSGEKVLEENGLIYGIGFNAKLVYPSRETLNARWELFLGNINYDGSIQTGEKAVTSTDYLGIRVEADKGFYKRLGNKVFIEPYFGGGYRWWLRNINDGQTATGINAAGYTELWQTLYLRTGVRGEINRENSLKPFGAIGINFPVFTTNNVHLSKVDSTLPDVTLNPRGQVSFNAEAGIEKGRLQLLLFYDQMRFAKSAAVSRIFQPESKANIWGIRVGAEL